MNKLTLLLILIILSFSTAFAQRKLNKADKLYDKLAYSEAVTIYEDLVLENRMDDHVIRRLAECYRQMKNTIQAEYWYSLVVGLKDANPKEFYYYAYLLKENQKYDESVKWYKKYATLENADIRAKQEISEQELLKKIISTPMDVRIRDLAINSKNADFGAVYYGENEVVFASSRDDGKAVKHIYMWDNMPFLDLYKATRQQNGNLENAVPLSEIINTKYHEGPATFNQNFTEIYFTRNDYYDKKLENGGDSTNHLHIYKAIKFGEDWGNVEPFDFNDKNYSTGHPTLSEDGERLYFASDMPGGYGGVDIYVCEKIGTRWGKPQNMGPNINTEGNEMFPFIHNSGVLYYSSNGLLGLGGLDIYFSVPTDSGFSKAVNMRAPINSSRDDFAFTAYKDGMMGYFSSNRDGGVGNDDIYAFFIDNPKNSLLSLIDGVPNSQWELFDQPVEDEPIDSINTNQNKNITPQYADGGMLPYDPNVRKYPLDSLTKNNIQLGRIYKLKNIYYDLDKWNIRPDAVRDLNIVLKFMQENPTVRIELSSHTDCRASDAYNMVLSNKRAMSAMAWLVDHGVDINRMTAQGYGEHMLVNECSDGVSCTEAEHQMNRRTEVRIIGM
jgi:outer membrane protein OmpA-like peptidoglycan-associated protein